MGQQSGMFALLHAAGCVEGYVEAKLSIIGLSLPKLVALSRLVEAGDSMTLGQLADRLSCVKSNVTQLVDRLEADGLVMRTPDPADRRSRIAVITDAGRKAYEQGSRIQEEAERCVFGLLTDDDRATFAALVAKLAAAGRAAH
jgi:DNA-binding MarR family transcriptional regulator